MGCGASTGSKDDAAGEAGGVDRVCSSCVNPPAAAGAEGESEGCGMVDSSGLAGSLPRDFIR
jgi:hypothetical protein